MISISRCRGPTSRCCADTLWAGLMSGLRTMGQALPPVLHGAADRLRAGLGPAKGSRAVGVRHLADGRLPGHLGVQAGPAHSAALDRRPLVPRGPSLPAPRDSITARQPGLDEVQEHPSESNITVDGLGDDEDLIVNDIGNFSGKYLVPSGVVLLRISSDGHWTMKKA